MRRGALVAGLAATALAVASLPAAAQNQLRITSVNEQDGVLQVALSSAGGVIDPGSVVVRLNGEEVPSTTEPLSQTTVSRIAVLAIDASGSMEGEPIDNAKAAGRAFVEGVPDDVQVGLVTFDETASVVVTPTNDKAAVVGAIDAIGLGGDTALYDAVVTSVQAAGEQGSRRVVLLTDGQNTAGTATQEDAVAAAGANETVVDAVALGDADVAALSPITGAGNGQLIETQDPAALVGLFSQAAEATASEVLATAEPPAAFAGSAVTIEVTANVAGQELSTTAATTLAGTPPAASPTATATPSPTPTALPAAAPPPAFLSTSWFVPLAVASVFVGLLGLLLVAFGPLGRRRKNEVTKRLSVYTLTSRGATEVERKEAAKSTAVATQALGVADSMLKQGGIEQSLENRLSAADVPMTPAEWLLLHVGSAVGGGLLLFLLSSLNPWWGFLGIGLGVTIPFLVLSVRKTNREKAFTDQLPDTLTLMAGSLTAGYSLPQAVDTVVREGQQPIAEEMNKALVEARLGVPIEEALENIAIRTQNKDFAWVVMAIRIQRQVGGNLSEILRIVADTLRERAYLRRQIRTLSAEGRISAIIIAAMPFVMLLYLILVRPEYVTLLFTDVWGIVMLIGVLVLQVIGWFWMRRLINFEV